ncbi:Putative serine-threonine/tyrosine-protein kinase catalytic domain containing protein [Klebsormidium nitens]|uniref:Putative serine-threonine/tyrosine-protein kinase catalytic domain containing protein n=1 Tax=Klebsormidium nitens TaxID=105231 RepID=A0A1Y1HWJ1_KLENI|nr:Putative serine-threonine/tyrosine-protein kinase catalytic domain containing protein [Klebsormidium nitens]|eukprot:GAQ80876.1 Putative serine-threonine/tyrosine-protein kinase catalytic domain containing protein [Klebsormidium nitens]
MVFGLVPCLSTISWLGRGPLRDAINYAYEESHDLTSSKAEVREFDSVLTCAPEQAGGCWRHLPSLGDHLGRCLHLLLSEKNGKRCRGCTIEQTIGEALDGKPSRRPAVGGDADIWSTEMGDAPWPAFQVDHIPSHFGLSKILLVEEELKKEVLSIRKLGRHVASGTYGHVFEAEVDGIGRAAVKLLNESMLKEEGNLEESYADFLMETSLHRRCRHQNIVHCYGLASLATVLQMGHPGQNAMVMELMSPDSTLTNQLRSRGGLPSDKLLSCALDVARALEHMHALGIIHFDVKSQNVMVDAWGVYKLTDFGLAFEAQGEPLDFYGRGSVAYMAPEVHDRSKLVDHKVDVFSFGVFMWEITTGLEPHRDLSYDEIVEGVLYRGLRPPLPEEAPAGLSAWMSLMQECWREAPKTRPSFATIVKKLETFL